MVGTVRQGGPGRGLARQGFDIHMLSRQLIEIILNVVALLAGFVAHG